MFARSVSLAALVALGVFLALAFPLGRAAALGQEGADGRFARRDSLHFTLHQDVDLDEHSGLRGSRQFEQDVLRELEAAYDRLGRLLALRPARKLVVTVWDPALFDREFAGLFRFPAAGFYGGTIHVRGGERVTEALVRVLHHELVHAALDAEAPMLVLPAWLNEGLAEWFEARAVGKRSLAVAEREALRRIAQAGGLPPLAALSGASLAGLQSADAAVAYLVSYAFVDFLAGMAGEQGLVELWSGIVRSQSVARGVRRAYRRELEELERAFLRSLGAA